VRAVALGIGLLVGAAAHAGPLRAQQIGQSISVPAAVGSVRRSADGRLALRAERVSADVRIDGSLDEAAWAAAEIADGFVQMEPTQGAPASERTVVRIAFDDENLYVGVYAFDSEPDRIIATDLRQDFNPDNQDNVQVLLDTFADRRNGYVFIVNPAGAQAEWQVANEGREVNTSWEAPWSAAARRVADGWTAELAIPFRALRFDPGGDGTWGINFFRGVRRKNEDDVWSPVPRAFSFARVSLAGNVEGVTSSSAGRDLRMKPYLADNTVREVGGDGFANDVTFGVDVKAGIAGSLVLDLTARPDFAQAEIDEQSVNLSQFSQFFPEKRDFFLENSGLFYVGDAARNTRGIEPRSDTDLLLFNSRRIGLTPDGRALPINAGLRLTGRVGGTLVGALAMRTQDDEVTPANDYAVIRLRQNVFEGGDVGAVFMTRRAVDVADDYNRVWGVDSNLRFFGSLDWSSYFIRTDTPGVTGDQYAWRTSFNRQSSHWDVKTGVMSLGDDFNDELGFYNRVGVRKWFLESGVRPRPSFLRRIGIRELHPHNVWSFFEDHDGKMVARRLHTGLSIFRSAGGSSEIAMNPQFELLRAPFRIARGIDPIPVGRYEWTEYLINFSTNPARILSSSMNWTWGELWTGTQRTFRVGLTVHPSAGFSASTSFSRTQAWLDLPDAEFVKSLWTMRASYSFTTAMFVDALGQYDPQQKLFNANVRFNLIHHPMSDLFIVLNEQRFMTDDGVAPGRSLIVKVTQMVAF
jgi:hypothetical protein